ncbi:hypothetical protein MCEMIE4_01219 [Sphingobium cupriresistens]
MLPGAIPIQRMEPVAGWIAKIIEHVGGFDHL